MLGCDVVTTHYETWDDVEFGKGWLPSFIPKSSKNIVTSNNLDVNTSEGEFTFDVSDIDEFKAKLTKVDDPSIPRNSKQMKLIKANYVPFEFSEDSSRWIFFIQPEAGHCKYWMYYIRETKANQGMDLTVKTPVDSVEGLCAPKVTPNVGYKKS